MKRLLAALTAIILLPVCAQAADLPTVAGEIKQDLRQAGQERVMTEQDISSEKEQLRAKVARLQSSLAAEQARLKQVRAELTEVSKQRAELSQEVAEKQGDIAELAGTVRAQARELLALAERSPVTAERPQRLEELRPYLGKSRFPGLDDIRKLVDLFFEEMQASGQITRRKGEYIDEHGQTAQADIIRIGGFSTVYNNGQSGYLTLGPSTGRLLAVSGDLPWGVGGSVDAYFSGADAVTMDISGGAALRQLARRSTFTERVLSGGPLVWPILLVGLVAIGLIGERLVFLRRVRANTDELMSNVSAKVAQGDIAGAIAEADNQEGRPTSNVIKAGLALLGQPQEVVESGLSEAILREMPRLERFIQVLKVLAGVSPLLGLLGTVTGMINTFHVITVHGTGDPRLMAGGISEALITTQLGLAVAIPILIAAALLGRRVQRIAGDMEEKALALAAAMMKAGA